MTTLSDKLKSLGVQVGARTLQPPTTPRNAHAIEQVLAGRLHATAHGDAFIVDTVYGDDYRHGQASLQLAVSLRRIAEWARDTRVDCDPSRLLFLDIETTGMAGGTGTFAFLVGIGRYNSNAFHLTQFFMRDPIEEPAMLAALADYMEPLGAFVTFNGKSFDLPLIKSRFITNGAPVPFDSPAHLDLLPLARRLWRERLASRALGSLETHILGATRTMEDVPGWLIPQMYFDYLRSGDARPLKRVFYHNAMDVLAMAALLNHIAQMLDDPLSFAIEHGLDLIAIGKLFEELGDLENAAKLIECGLKYDLSEEMYREATRRLSRVHRRRGAWAEAIELWREAARHRQMYGYVELAKYYEHRARDYDEAIRWTREALAVIADSPPYLRAEWQAELEHRLARLEGKRI